MSLNGAQIASLVELVQNVAAGTMPKDSAMEIMLVSFPIDKAQAERILGAAAKGIKFKPANVKV